MWHVGSQVCRRRLVRTSLMLLSNRWLVYAGARAEEDRNAEQGGAGSTENQLRQAGENEGACEAAHKRGQRLAGTAA